ncbi:hypothetical protein AK812_SmicGene3824 [Symbiodinium microadriaticum]|uniref:Uncharacterized protein n=1 Tax=Symbiodinium microadriaticum TaxID=2951 RepID=A0A1Q9EXU7_SYMMI|nr:hypothetical protein AK812_SmicGene3824 [Symbiodinium microadriaticum]
MRRLPIPGLLSGPSTRFINGHAGKLGGRGFPLLRQHKSWRPFLRHRGGCRAFLVGDFPSQAACRREGWRP